MKKEKRITDFIQNGYFIASFKTIRDSLSKRTFIREIIKYGEDYGIKSYDDYLYDNYVAGSLDGNTSTLNKLDFQREHSLTLADMNKLTKNHRFKFAPLPLTLTLNNMDLSGFIKDNMFTEETTSLALFLGVTKYSLEKYAASKKIRLYNPALILKKYIDKDTFTMNTSDISAETEIPKWYIYQYAKDNNISFCRRKGTEKKSVDILAPYINKEYRFLTVPIKQVVEQAGVKISFVENYLSSNGYMTKKEFKQYLLEKYKDFTEGAKPNQKIILSKNDEAEAARRLGISETEVSNDMKIYRKHFVKKETISNARKIFKAYLAEDKSTVIFPLLEVSRQTGISTIQLRRMGNAAGYSFASHKMKTAEERAAVDETFANTVEQYVIDSNYKVTKYDWSQICDRHKINYIEFYNWARKKGYITLSKFFKDTGYVNQYEFKTAISKLIPQKYKKELYKMSIYEAGRIVGVHPLALLIYFILMSNTPRSIYSFIISPENVILIEPKYVANVLGNPAEKIEEFIKDSNILTIEEYAAEKNIVLPQLSDVIEKMYDVPHHPRQKYRARQQETD